MNDFRVEKNEERKNEIINACEEKRCGCFSKEVQEIGYIRVDER